MSLLAYVLTAAALILCVPVAVFTIEVVAAIAVKGRTESENEPSELRPRITVLVPAHDERTGIVPTIKDMRAQLRPGDRLLVVADNCSDDTAKLAASAGAEVIERHDPAKLGKGYALDLGLRHLQADPPDIVIMIDADCHLAEHGLDRLALSCETTGRPAQALYFMKEAPECESATGQRAAQFAWIVKTYVRPMGLAKLGLPCQLMGTGMAFPWRAICSVELASSNLVEDLKLGLDLAARGMAPRLCPQTYVESAFPASAIGTLTQRHRWEVGSLRTLTADAPVVLWKALVSRNFSLFVLALDALVPPLVILGAALILALLLAAPTALAGIAVAPLLIAAGALILFVAGIVLAWSVYGRSVLRIRDAGSLMAHLLQKLRVYRPRGRRSSQWIRTDRQ